MNLKLLIVLGALLLGGAAIGFYAFAGRQGPPRARSAHGVGIDNSMAVLRVMQEAPEGKTPCESTWLALHAEQEAAKAAGTPSIFVRLAPREEFLTHCEKLPQRVQQCLVPRHRAQDADCARMRPAAESLDPLFELRPDWKARQDSQHAAPEEPSLSGAPPK